MPLRLDPAVPRPAGYRGAGRPVRRPTTIAVDWTAPIQSFSLSRLEPLGAEAMGIALTCLSSWGRAMREINAPGDLRINIRDEM